MNRERKTPQPEDVIPVEAIISLCHSTSPPEGRLVLRVPTYAPPW